MKSGIYGLYKAVREFMELEGYYFLNRIRAKYYIIIRSEGGAGFFSNYMWVLGHVVFARRLGYIPVVDMKNYPTLYSEDITVDGVDNAWNYYFENIGGVSLEEAYASDKYVVGKDKYLTKYAEKYSASIYRFPTEKMVVYYYPIIERNIRIREDLKREYEQEWRRKTEGAGHILGVHIRGTDMKNDLGHPMPASVDVYLEQTKQMLSEHSEISKIFLATDENNVRELYEQAFADTRWTLVMNDAFRVWDHGEKRKVGVHETVVEHPRERHRYLLGKEVLQDAWFLSKCDYLICGYSNITNTVIMWKNNRFLQLVCIQSDGSVYRR